MRLLIILISLGLLLAASLWHLGLVFQAITSASMAAEGQQMWQLAWGKTLLVDVYLGLLAVALWMLWLERGRWPGYVWALCTLVLGNAVLVLFLAVQAHKRFKNDQL